MTRQSHARHPTGFAKDNLAKEKGASRRPDIRYFPAIQFKSSAVPAITNAPPANITSGQRLRG
jgi:hypothetical protein